MRKRSAHQANLVARYVNEGAAVAAWSFQASSFAAPFAQGAPRTAATGTATRLWTYLMADYFDDVAMSAREYVPRRLVVTCELRPPMEDGARRLQELYRGTVIPEDMLDM